VATKTVYHFGEESKVTFGEKCKVTFAAKDFSTYIKGSILGERVLVKAIFLIEAVIWFESLQINRRIGEQAVSSR